MLNLNKKTRFKPVSYTHLDVYKRQVYGLTKVDDSPGEIAFSCNEVFIQNSPEPFGDKFSGKGLYNPENKTIIYDFTNGYGDVGKVTLKKK